MTPAFKQLNTTDLRTESVYNSLVTQDLVFDFSNDRHHFVAFNVGESPTRIAEKLRLLATRIERDPHLRA